MLTFHRLTLRARLVAVLDDWRTLAIIVAIGIVFIVAFFAAAAVREAGASDFPCVETTEAMRKNGTLIDLRAGPDGYRMIVDRAHWLSLSAGARQAGAWYGLCVLVDAIRIDQRLIDLAESRDVTLFVEAADGRPLGRLFRSDFQDIP